MFEAFLVSSSMQSSILTIFYIFSFCPFFKLDKSSLQILQFISGHLIFLGSVDFSSYLVVALFEFEGEFKLLLIFQMLFSDLL